MGLSALLGGGGDDLSLPALSAYNNPYAEQLANIATKQMANARGVYEPIYEDFVRFLRPDTGTMYFGDQNQYAKEPTYRGTLKYDPQQLPAFNWLFTQGKQGIEDQYGQARQQIMSQMPRGGALEDALLNLEMNRAKSAGGLTAQIAAPLAQDIYNKAYSYAVGAPAQTMSGLSSAAGIYGNALNTALAQTYGLQAQQQLANMQGKTSNLGMLGLALGQSIGRSWGSTTGAPGNAGVNLMEFTSDPTLWARWGWK
jgi:hypothetical protein